MAYFFSQATIAVEVFSFGYIAGAFALHTHHRLKQIPGWRTYQAAQRQAKVPDPSPPIKRKLSPVEQLRQQCQQAGIKWRNAHGQNKHLKKAEMLLALQQLESVKQVVTVPASSLNLLKRVA